MRNVSFNRGTDTIEVIVRDGCFNKIFQKEVNTTNKKEIGRLLADLKNKGVDLIGIIKERMLIGDDEWF